MKVVRNVLLIIVGILLFCFIAFFVSVFTIGFPFTFSGRKLNVQSECNKPNNYEVAQCPNGDYWVEQVFYDSEGNALMWDDLRGKSYLFRGWWREQVRGQPVGCIFGDRKIICSGEISID